jgi:hypothetical protein
VTTLDPGIRLTNFQPADGIRRGHVPEHLRRLHASEDKEFAAREMAREGFAADAIAEALGLDVKKVRHMIGDPF